MFASTKMHRALPLLFALIFLIIFLSMITQPSPVQAEASQNWSTPLPIENIDQAVAVTRSIDGTVHVIGVQNGLLATLVYVSLAPGSSSWSIPEPIGTTFTGGGIRSVDTVITSDGRVHVVWDVADLGFRWVQYAVRATNGNWSTPQILSEKTYEAYQVSIVVGSQDQIYVNWWAANAAAGFFTRYQDDNGTWLATQQVDAGSGYPSQQQTLVDADGNIHFFWNDLSGTQTIGGIYHRMLSNANVWQATTKVSDDLFASSAWTQDFRAVIQGSELYVIL